uniref:Uncharacterized protein n=1 Tax=Xiangshan insect virus TaxID=2886242 RepID=A0A8K1P3F1_9VIRU|nr:MAG: hypothetical protein [Xiangshan insect virus]
MSRVGRKKTKPIRKVVYRIRGAGKRLRTASDPLTSLVRNITSDNYSLLALAISAMLVWTYTREANKSLPMKIATELSGREGLVTYGQLIAKHPARINGLIVYLVTVWLVAPTKNRVPWSMLSVAAAVVLPEPTQWEYFWQSLALVCYCRVQGRKLKCFLLIAVVAVYMLGWVV